MCLAVRLILKVALIAICVVLFLGFVYQCYYISTLDHSAKPEGYWLDLLMAVLYAIVFLFLSLTGLHGAIKESRNSLNSFWSSMVCIIILTIIQFIITYFACQNKDDDGHWTRSFAYCIGNPWAFSSDGVSSGVYIKYILIAIAAAAGFIISFLLYKEVKRTKDQQY